jgi:hypothetical protein
MLAMYEVQAGTLPDDAKADAIAEIVISLWGQAEVDAAFYAALRMRPAVASAVTTPARRFIGSAERLTQQIGDHSTLEWSGVVIGYCKAVEAECLSRLIEPLKERLGEPGTQDLTDPDFGRIAAYCDRRAKAPELGSIRHFLTTAAHSKSRAASSPMLKAFASMKAEWSEPGWLEQDNGAQSALLTLTTDFRNRAAHIDELTAQDAAECRDLVLGQTGIIELLISSTTPRAA